MPTLITADDRAQVSLGISHESIRATVDDLGIDKPKSAQNVEELQTISLRGAYLFSDLFQAGFELPLVRRFRRVATREDSSVGIGDVSVSLGYEFLPETTYSWWRPRGYLFSRLTLPTGESTSDPSATATSATGRGFYSWAVGAVLLKTFRQFDLVLAGEGHVNFARTFGEGTATALRYGGGVGASGLLSVGFSPGGSALRIGATVNPSTDGGRSLQGAFSGETQPRYVWNTSLALSYRMSTEWSSTLTYLDQTLLPSRNVDISRSVSLLFQRHFEL